LPPPSVSKLIDPSFQTKAQEDALRFVGPAPDFTTPQAEARLNLRGSGFEIAVLGGTALEKLPAFYYTPRINSLLTANVEDDGTLGEAQTAADQIASGYRLIDVVYHRYYLLGLDGSFDIAPVQVGFEFAYSPSRHLYATDTTGRALPAPDVSKQIADPDDARWMDTETNNMQNARQCLSSIVACAKDPRIRKGVQMVQAALHLEYLKGETLLLMAEGYLFQALELPHSRDRQWLGFPKGTGTYVAGLVAGTYNVQEGKYRFDLSVLATMGPSFIITPQIEFRLTDTFYLNIGAQFYEGPTPNNWKGSRKIATNLTPGGVLSGYDNVYLGFHWTP
jgi:hypothetical protein